MTCTAKTKRGGRCRRPALRGRETCHAHSGERVGRRAALTPEVHERLVQLVKVGCCGEAAARAAGISASTYYDILRTGRSQSSGPERDLLEALERASGEAYAYAMANWRREMGAPGNWRANVAWIDRFDRDRFPLEARAPEGRASPPAERRPDLRLLSEEQLGSLEALYADTESEEGEDER